MRHRKGIRKLGKPTDQRVALIRNGVQALLEHGQIVTTWRRAKEIQKKTEEMITLAKDGRLAPRRQAYREIAKKAVVQDLFREAPERFGSRRGGYTRVMRMGDRRGDGAPMAVIQLVS